MGNQITTSDKIVQINQIFYGNTFWNVDVIPISWAIDGTTAPAALAEVSSTNKARFRDFAVAGSDVFFEWEVPYGIVVASGIYFQAEGWITNVAPPAANETAIFSLSGVSLDDNEILSTSQGSAVVLTKTFASGFAQYDRWVSGWSTVVTVNGFSAFDLALLKFQRPTATPGTYGQAIGVGWLKIKYEATMQQS